MTSQKTEGDWEVPRPRRRASPASADRLTRRDAVDSIGGLAKRFERECGMKQRSGPCGVAFLLGLSLCVVGALSLARLGFAQQQSGLSTSAGLPPVGEPRSFAIRGARIVTVSGAPIEKGTILVEGDSITSVGGGEPIPPDAAVIDGTGLTVYPGLIDAGTTVGLPGAEPAEGPAPPGRGHACHARENCPGSARSTANDAVERCCQ
jgi:hypothetical protein